MEDLNTLINVAKKVDEVEIDEIRNDLPIEGLMMLEETSGALDFLKDEKEDIYTVDDLKVRYQLTMPIDYRLGGSSLPNLG